MDGITVDSTLLAAKPPTPEKAPRSFYRLLPFEFTRKEERRKRDEKTDRQTEREGRSRGNTIKVHRVLQGGRKRGEILARNTNRSRDRINSG